MGCDDGFGERFFDMLTTLKLKTVLPRLRRHAYLLVGNMPVADAAVGACLKVLPRDTAGRPVCADLPALFRSLHAATLVPSEPIPGPDAACEEDAHLAETRDRFLALAPVQRRVLALVLVEGFSVAETAQILVMERRRVAEALLGGRHRMARPLRRLRAVIIEDDQLIGMDIAASLEEMGYGTCIQAADGREAVEAAAGGEPDLIIADVKLSNGDSGLDVVRRLRTGGRSSTPVVYVTAFPEIPLADPTISADAVLPKPFSTAALKQMVRRSTMKAPAA